MNRTHTPIAVVLLALSAAAAQAATVTNVFNEQFDDATLVAGLTNQSSTPIGGGVANLDGANGNNAADGFTFSLTPYLDVPNRKFITSWAMELIIAPGDIQVSNAANVDALFSLTGYMGLRRTSTAANFELMHTTLNAGGPTSTTIVGGVTALTAGDHLALVYQRNAGANDDVISYYRNQTLVASLTGDFDVLNGGTFGTNAGFGLETHPGAPNSRGFDISLDAVAFSTFTGTFDVADDFELIADEVPAPAALPAGLMVLVLAAARRRRD